jgi:hypothetical protein
VTVVRGPLVASGAVPARISRLLRLAALAVVVVLVAAACQVQVATTVKVEPDGSGTVTQAVGFDASALARVGDLRQQLRVADLEAAGWTVDEPVTEDTTTWVRAHHDFADADEANVVLAQLSGPDGPYRELAVTRTSSVFSTTTKVSGTMDLSAGVAMFGDPQLTQTLGADGSGGLVAKIQAEEGRPVREMVDVSMTVDLPGADETVQGTLDSAPQAIDVSSSENHFFSLVWKLLVVVLVVLTAVVVGLRLRSRRLRTKRMMRSRLPRR